MFVLIPMEHNSNDGYGTYLCSPITFNQPKNINVVIPSMKRPQRELSIGVWVDFGRILARKPVAGVLGSTVLNNLIRDHLVCIGGM